METIDLQKALKEHALWLTTPKEGKRADFSRARLAGADLYGADLIRADLTEADLYAATLSRANLSGAKLTRATLIRADLSEANLIRATLVGVDLCGAKLAGADLYGADLHGADLTGAHLHGAGISETILSNAKGIIDAGRDQRGYRFIGANSNDGIRVLAGCRYFTIKEAEHWWAMKSNKDALLRVAVIKNWAQTIK